MAFVPTTRRKGNSRSDLTVSSATHPHSQPTAASLPPDLIHDVELESVPLGANAKNGLENGFLLQAAILLLQDQKLVLRWLGIVLQEYLARPLPGHAGTGEELLVVPLNGARAVREVGPPGFQLLVARAAAAGTLALGEAAGIFDLVLAAADDRQLDLEVVQLLAVDGQGALVVLHFPGWSATARPAVLAKAGPAATPLVAPGW